MTKRSTGAGKRSCNTDGITSDRTAYLENEDTAPSAANPNHEASRQVHFASCAAVTGPSVSLGRCQEAADASRARSTFVPGWVSASMRTTVLRRLAALRAYAS